MTFAWPAMLAGMIFTAFAFIANMWFFRKLLSKGSSKLENLNFSNRSLFLFYPFKLILTVAILGISTCLFET